MVKEPVEFITFTYEPWNNRMVDEDGEVVYDIFRYITPAMYNYWKNIRTTGYIQPVDRPGIMYEFIFGLYQDYEDEEYWHSLELEESEHYN
jgi:hypothetical protein